MSAPTPSQQRLYPRHSDSSKGSGEPGSSHGLPRPRPNRPGPHRQSEETKSQKTPDRPSVSETSIPSSTSSSFSPAPPPNEGPFPSMSLTRANLMKHDRTSRRLDDPFALQLMRQERSAKLKDAMRSLDTGDLPLPDSVVNKVAATSEGLRPMERYTIGSYHREQSRVDDETLLRERMNGRYHRRKV